MLNKVLKDMRNYHRMSQRELSDILGISKSHISELENGKKNPSLGVLELYSETFFIPISAIFIFAEAYGYVPPMYRHIPEKLLKMMEWVRDSKI